MTKVNFAQLSNLRCSCGKQLKLNVVNRKTRNQFLRCYTCYKDHEYARGHYINQNPRKKRVLASLPIKQF